MLRFALSAFAVVLCLSVAAVAQDAKDKADEGAPPKDAIKATIARVDETGNKITLKWTDKDGKPQEKMFEVKDAVKLYGPGGKPVRLNQFKAGGPVFFTYAGENLTG